MCRRVCLWCYSYGGQKGIKMEKQTLSKTHSSHTNILEDSNTRVSLIQKDMSHCLMLFHSNVDAFPQENARWDVWFSLYGQKSLKSLKKKILDHGFEMQFSDSDAGTLGI